MDIDSHGFQFAILTAGIALGLGSLLAALIWRTRISRPENRWLAAYTGVFALLSCGDVIRLTAPDNPISLPFETVLLWLGPCFMRYLDNLCRSARAGWRKWEFLPGAVLTLWALLEAILGERSPAALSISFWIVAPAQTSIYILLAIRSVRMHRIMAKQCYANLAGVDLQWLVLLVGASVLLWVFWLWADLTHSPVAQMLNRAGFPLVAYGLTLGGWRQQPMNALPRDAAEKSRVKEAKYARSALDEGRIRHMEVRLEALMDNERLFANPALDLDLLAARLGETPQNLSQYLNQVRQVSFYDYINGLRCDALAEILRQPERAGMPILDLALEVGFNAKSTLHQAFRKRFGCTPGEYRKQPNIQGSSRPARTKYS